MSKFNKVKNIKNISSLDINKLYKLQEYVSVSQEFFKEFDTLVYKYLSSSDCDDDYDFVRNSIVLYISLKDKLNVK